MVATSLCPECHGDLSALAEGLSLAARCVYCGASLKSSAPPTHQQPTVAELLDRMRQDAPPRPLPNAPTMTLRSGLCAVLIVGCVSLLGYGMFRHGYGAGTDTAATNAPPFQPLLDGDDDGAETGEIPSLAHRHPRGETSRRPTATANQPAMMLGPRSFHPHTIDELLRAADAVSALATCRECSATGLVIRPVSRVVRIDGKLQQKQIDKRLRCDACGGKTTGKLSLEAYSRLCQLAEAATFVSGSELDPRAADCRQQVGQAVLNLANTPEKLQIVGRQAAAHLANRSRLGNGLALAGTVQASGQSDDLHWIRLVLLGQPTVVTVVSWRPSSPPVVPDERVLVMGTVVDDPASNLLGYNGTLPQVVWGGMLLRVE